MSDAVGDHDGTGSGGLTYAVATASGDTGLALEAGRVVVPDAAALSPDAVTVEALIRWDGPTGIGGEQQRILEKSTESANVFAVYGLSVREDGTVVGEITVGTTSVAIDAPCALRAGEWADVALTYDGSAATLYVNGGAMSDVTVPGTLSHSTEPLGLGNNANRDRPFRGVLDEVALYDHALTEERIVAHAALVTLGAPHQCDVVDTDAGVEVDAASSAPDAASATDGAVALDAGGTQTPPACCGCTATGLPAHGSAAVFGIAALALIIAGRRRRQDLRSRA
ncbi:MAG: LamG domain-containing protein [Sandaracinus sp.]